MCIKKHVHRLVYLYKMLTQIGKQADKIKKPKKKTHEYYSYPNNM